MELVVTERFGDKPIIDWYKKSLKQFAQEKFGIEIEVDTNKEHPDYKAD